MQLYFVSRGAYNAKDNLKNEYNQPGFYWIDEGGYSRLGAEGAKDICTWIDGSYTDIVCAVGTGTMMAGLIIGAMPHQKVTGISVLKGNGNLTSDIEKLLTDKEKGKRFELLHDYHFGGYAKHPKKLTDWMNTFYTQANVPTDIVYTAKLCYAINDLFSKNYFALGSKVMVIHSGGLQGNNSLKAGTLIF
jgi:1-aminocyclopropane-1-carboxylate deaminase